MNYLFQDVCSSYHIEFLFNFVIFLRFIHIYTEAIKVPAIPLQHTDTHMQIQTPYTLIFLNIYCPILFNEFLYYVNNTNMFLLFLFCLFEQQLFTRETVMNCLTLAFWPMQSQVQFRKQFRKILHVCMMIYFSKIFCYLKISIYVYKNSFHFLKTSTSNMFVSFLFLLNASFVLWKDSTFI